MNKCLYIDKECHLFGDCDICPTYQNRNTSERNFMRQLNCRKEWVEYFDNADSKYFLVRWVGMNDGKEHEEPVYFEKGEYGYQEMVPTISTVTLEVEPMIPFNPLPEKIIIVKELTEEEVKEKLKSIL